ncbi:Metallo-hydrolase/oxidoreductase [Collybia nuda]|uniref:Metallo-hydrolase/oxidoreductase n=1 Tax=Collybia nuda TaxID=64659 RepID=A0A9P5YEN2_9AGAR|nr:Metallo-hydrolase/oxidoreductase [Collybia nuda]
MSLPPPGSKQPFCNVSALEAGLIRLPLAMFVTNVTDPSAVIMAPSLSFLVQHSLNQKKFVFDLGIRKDWENCPPKVVEMVKLVSEIHIYQDVTDSLIKGGISPLDITTVCLSHCHFDHVGDTRPFINSTFIVGSRSKEHFQPGYPADPNSVFSSNLLPPTRTEFLSSTDWPSLGPFPHALDFYGDGSLYIIDSPGHLAGHITVLARTSPDGAWIYLAGDSAHHWDLITGKADIAVGHPLNPHSCAHQDKEAAEAHILRIREMLKNNQVRVLLAHDEPWFANNKGGDAFLPGKIASL